MKVTARCEWDENSGWWTADVVEVAGAHTQSKRLDLISTNVVEVVELMAGKKITIDNVVIEIDYDSLGDAGEETALAKQTREQYLALEEELDAHTRAAVKRLRHRGFALRDIGTLVGVSHQRVHQLLDQ